MITFKTIFGFIILGIALEVFWTGILDSIKTKNRKLTGQTYLWVIPIYGVVPFIYLFVLRYFGDANIFLRGIVYMILFYILEFVSGRLIKKSVGVSPRDYTGYSIKLFGKTYISNFQGLICLQYAPIWFIYGIGREFYYLFLMNL